MTDLMELASRVEAGTWPNREMDMEIAVAIGWYPPGVDPALFADAEIRPLYANHVPAFTASRDAARMLDLGGWDYGSGIKGSSAWAYVHNRQPRFLGVGTRSNPDHVWIEVATEVEARALTACWLRARAHQGAAHVD